jgi:class 3 adenylate cyclase
VAALLATLAAYAVRWYVSLPLNLLIAAAAFAVVLVGHARGIILPTVPVELTILIGTVAAWGARALARDRRNEVVAHAFDGRISPDVWNTVLAAGTPPLDGEIREVTVMLCNVRGFSIHSEGRDPQAVMRELNEYFQQMTECILRAGGMVQQYSGDRVLALFGTPARYHDHARRAVVCAMEMLTRMDLLNERRTGASLEQWRIGIGIHSGELMLGFVGDRVKRLEYAANGEALAVAARMESGNKEFGTQILLSVATRDRMGLDIATTWKGVLVSDDGNEEAVYTV